MIATLIHYIEVAEMRRAFNVRGETRGKVLNFGFQFDGKVKSAGEHLLIFRWKMSDGGMAYWLVYWVVRSIHGDDNLTYTYLVESCGRKGGVTTRCFRPATFQQWGWIPVREYLAA